MIYSGKRFYSLPGYHFYMNPEGLDEVKPSCTDTHNKEMNRSANQNSYSYKLVHKMKSTMFLISLILFCLASSCFKEPIIRFGFDTGFGKKSQGLTIMNVGNSAATITLKGNLIVTEGQVLAELINPKGETVFQSHLISPKSVYVNESFPAVKGNWKLKYKSMEGVGSLTLHLNVVDQKL